MKVLGIDSATSACSAAVVDNDRVVAHRYETMSRGQSEALMPMIEGALGEARLAASDLDLIAVTVGPGAFTGLRIAIATSLGLSLATGVRVAGVSTTEAIAYGARTDAFQSGNMIVALDSRREDLYLQAFSGAGLALGPVEAVSPGAANAWVAAFAWAGPLTLVGDAAMRLRTCLDGGLALAEPWPDTIVPDAAWVARLASEKCLAGLAMLAPRPLYLRPADAVVPKDGGRLRP